MQWNTSNMTKEEIKRRQEEYIKVAIEMSKKAKQEADISIAEPVIINIPSNETKSEKTKEITIETNPIAENNAIETDMTETIDVSSEAETTEEVLQNNENNDHINNLNETNIFTAASKDFQSDEITQSAEEIFANVFITEEEAEEKLREEEKAFEDIAEEIPDFNKYIENHNIENTDTSSTSNADE